MNLLQEKTAVPIFFGLYLLIGLFIFQDYGISWDEHIQRKHGWVTIDYLNETFGLGNAPLTEEKLHDYHFKFHGTFYQLFCHSLEQIFGLDERGSFLLRHLIVFLLVFMSSIFLYRLAKQRMESWRWAVLATATYIMHPRIFAHSFYNPKDTVFMALFVIGMYLLFRFLKSKSFWSAILLGLVTAFLINARALGILLPFFSFVFVLMEWLRSKDSNKYIKRNYKFLLSYLASAFLLTVAIWPYLWSSPISNYIHAFNSLKKFFWETDVLYYGQLVKSTDLPWHYIQGWMLVTTPIVFLIFFLWGLGWRMLDWLKYFIKKPLRFYKNEIQKIDMLLLGWVIVPSLAVIILQSTLYDGWRHMYFIWPAMAVLAVLGVQCLYHIIGAEHKYRTLAPGIMIAAMLTTLFFIVRDHPYQNTYFNVLAGTGDKLDKNFEQEYWGLSCGEVLQHLMSIDNRPEVKVFASSEPVGFNVSYLKAADRARIKLVPFEEAEYFVYHHRFEAAKAQYYDRVYPFTNELYTVKNKGIVIAGLYDMRKQ